MTEDSILGLSRIIQTSIPSDSVILIAGGPGTLKSGFVGTYISNAIKGTDMMGVYLTVEEAKDSLLRNWKELKIDIPDSLKIIDFRDIRRELQPTEDTHALSFLEEVISSEQLLGGEKFRFFALDSLGALYSMIGRDAVRSKLFTVFQKLKEFGLTAFFIYEEKRGFEYDFEMADEAFLTDGIIKLGITTKGSRFIRVEKMRACKHSMQPHHLDVGPHGLSILGPRLE